MLSVLIIVGFTAMVGLVQGEGQKPSSSGGPLLGAPGWPSEDEHGSWWSLCKQKQFLQEPGFQMCSTNSLHADIFGSPEVRGEAWCILALRCLGSSWAVLPTSVYVLS